MCVLALLALRRARRAPPPVSHTSPLASGDLVARIGAFWAWWGAVQAQSAARPVPRPVPPRAEAPQNCFEQRKLQVRFQHSAARSR